jgi:FtsZ-interacting cell division protein ZipA
VRILTSLRRALDSAGPLALLVMAVLLGGLILSKAIPPQETEPRPRNVAPPAQVEEPRGRRGRDPFGGAQVASEAPAATSVSRPPAAVPPTNAQAAPSTTSTTNRPVDQVPVRVEALPAAAPTMSEPSGGPSTVANVQAQPQERDEELAEEKYVPVVFTHKDGVIGMRVFADLQRKYPGILIDRQGQVQSVDLGVKGTWHRLVVLPPASREEATTLCDRLAAAGYDTCWIKPY